MIQMNSPSVLKAAAFLSAAVSFHCNAILLLDASTASHSYDGHGALSAGASSRLLWDYQEPQRSQILDYLFKPNFGANLHLLKVEIGGDAQSTDGSEPSPQHNRDEPMDCNRGYESWLLQQAKLRNPDIVTYGLSWAVPNWIGNGSYFSPDNWAYQAEWAGCVKTLTGDDLDYIGVWNERSWGSPEYVIGLRGALDAAGLSHTQIIIPDGGSNLTGILDESSVDPAFLASWDGMGLHYPCDHAIPQVQGEFGKKFWASEDYSTVADWAGAGCWGRMLVQNYVRMNMTSTISWSLIWSVYPALPYFGNGLMYAMEPHSGHYSGGGHAPGQDPDGDLMNGPLWTSAHVTQFTQPGWKFLSVPGGGSGVLPGGGAYTTLVPPGSPPATDFTLILETLEGDCLRCKGSPTSPQTLTFSLASSMPGPGTKLAVWRTNMTDQFISQPPITVGADGTFTVSIGEDEMVTVTTIQTGNKGSFPSSPVPPSSPFPMPYTDNFNGYAYDAMARFFSDQAGSFAVRNGSLMQVVAADPGPNAWINDPDPISVIGGGVADAGWQDYSVSATVLFSDSSPLPYPLSPVSASARKAFLDKMESARGPSSTGSYPAFVTPCNPADASQGWVQDVPAAGYLSNKPPSRGGTQLCLNLDGCGVGAIYFECVTSGGTCCGDSCYAGLQWSLPSPGIPGPITSPLSDMSGKCLSVDATGSVAMVPCGGANQTWTSPVGTRTSASGAGTPLMLAGSGLCLTAPEYANGMPYAQIAGRVVGYSPPTGYRLALDINGTYTLRSGTVTLQQGFLPSGYNSSLTPVTLTLTMQGNNITGTVSVAADDTRAGESGARSYTGSVSVPDPTYKGGLAAVGSGFHAASFDNFAVTPA